MVRREAEVWGREDRFAWRRIPLGVFDCGYDAPNRESIYRTKYMPTENDPVFRRRKRARKDCLWWRVLLMLLYILLTTQRNKRTRRL